MRYCEIVPKSGSSYILVDGQEWSRHDDVKVAEAVRLQLISALAEYAALYDELP